MQTMNLIQFYFNGMVYLFKVIVYVVFVIMIIGIIAYVIAGKKKLLIALVSVMLKG